MKALIFFLALSVFSCIISYSQNITIDPYELSEPEETSGELKKISWENPDFSTLEPVLSEKHDHHIYTAWMAVSAEGLILKIQVRDPEHNYEFSERNLWRGDAVFVGIDTRGDNPDGETAGLTGNDDAVFIIGLGSEGPDGWIDKTGNTELGRKDVLSMIRNISRNEKRKLTTYELAIPWDVMNSHPMITRSVGLSLTIKDEGRDESLDFDWGTARTVRREPLIMNRFTIPDGIGTDPMVIVPVKRRLRGPGEQAEFLVAWNPDLTDRVLISLGEYGICTDSMSMDMHTARVRVPGEMISPENPYLSFRAYMNENIMSFFSIDLETPEVLYTRFYERIRKLIGRSPNEIVTLHLESTLKVVENVYNSMDIPRLPSSRGNPDDIDQFFETVSYIYSKLPEDRYEWDRFIKQCIPLTFAFRSSVDYSLQFYSLQMPYMWDETKAYPLTVYLHGSGPGHPLQGLQNGYDNRWQNTIFREVDIHPDSIPGAHRGFLVAPWGRGNSGYRGYAENDIFEILEIVQHHFNIDTSRMYLSGFSMGCDGSINIATQKPEIWAGINLASGFHRMEGWKDNPLLKNLQGIPLCLWVGELDTRMYEGMKIFMQVADELGFDYTKEVAPNLPHTYPYMEYMDNIEYLMQFDKKRD